MNRLQGKKVAITGAASGIGLSAAHLMAAEGAQVLIADLHASAAGQAAAEIRDAGGEAIGMAVDVMDEDSTAAMIERAAAEFGGLTTLCNHVGGSNPKKDLDLLGMDMDEWDRVMTLNARSTVVASKLALPHMIDGGGGSIINTASIGGLLGDALQCAYGASKAAVIRLTQYIATQYGDKGIRCNAIAPGSIMTPALRDNLQAEVTDGIRNANPMRELGDASDIGYAMVYLASDEAKYMTGQTLVVDGGLTSQNALVPARREMLG